MLFLLYIEKYISSHYLSKNTMVMLFWVTVASTVLACRIHITEDESGFVCIGVAVSRLVEAEAKHTRAHTQKKRYEANMA